MVQYEAGVREDNMERDRQIGQLTERIRVLEEARQAGPSRPSGATKRPFPFPTGSYQPPTKKPGCLCCGKPSHTHQECWTHKKPHTVCGLVRPR
jgi:hypothetical protein